MNFTFYYHESYVAALYFDFFDSQNVIHEFRFIPCKTYMLHLGISIYTPQKRQ